MMPRKTFYEYLESYGEAFDLRNYLEVLTLEIDHDPQNAAAYYDRGLAKAAYTRNTGGIKDYDQIIEDYDVAIRLNPQYAVALKSQQYAIAYYNRGVAKFSFANAIKAAHPEDNLEEIADYSYYDKDIPLNHRYADAIQDFDKAIHLNPQDAFAYYYRGLAKAALGQHSEAIQDYNVAIHHNNTPYADAHYNRGLAKAALGQHSEAIQDYDVAIQYNNREYVSACYNRGLAKAALGQHSEAVQDYDKAIHYSKEHADAYYNRAHAKAALGQHTEAIQDYDEAIRLNPRLDVYRQHREDWQCEKSWFPRVRHLYVFIKKKFFSSPSPTNKDEKIVLPEKASQSDVKMKFPSEVSNKLPVRAEERSTILSPTTMNIQAQAQLERFAEKIQELEKELITSPAALKTRLQDVETKLDKSQQNPLLLSPKVQLALETQLEELQLSLQVAGSQLAAQDQLKIIQENPVLEHFYIAFQLTLGNIFISAKAAQGEFVSRNETQTKKQTAFVLLEKVSVHIPMAGVLLQALALVGQGWEAKKQIAAIKRLSEFMVIATPLEVFIENLARQLTLIQQAELENMPLPKDLITDLKRLLKKLIQPISLNLADNPIRERAQEQVQRIVVSLLQEELSTQPELEDIPSFCSYALQRPVPIIETQTVNLSQMTVVNDSQETSFTAAFQTLITQQQQEIAALKAQLLKEQQERKQYQEEQEQKMQQLERWIRQGFQTSVKHNSGIEVAIGANQMGLFAQKRAQLQAGVQISPAELQYSLGQLREELTDLRSAVVNHTAQFEQSDNAARLIPSNKPAKKVAGENPSSLVLR